MKPEEEGKECICSIVFLDIAQFSQQSSEVQFSWRIELSMLLDKCLAGMGPDRRIVTDTSNGAAIAFLSSAEDALSFVRCLFDEFSKSRSFALRIGAHHGLLSVVQGQSGRPGIVGEGVNAAQRAMRFAGANEVLVSRAFQEEVVRLAAADASMFSPHGKQSQKLGREHDLFRMALQPAASGSPAHAAPPVPPAPSIPNVPPGLLAPSAFLAALAPSAPSIPLAVPKTPAAQKPSAMPEPLAPPEPSAVPESSAAPEPLAAPESSAAPSAQGEDITPPVAKSPGLGIKLALLGAFLVIAAGIGLWVASGDREQGTAAPPAVESAVPESAVPPVVPEAADSAVAAQPEQAQPAITEKPGLTVTAPSGKVGEAKKDQAARKDRRVGRESCPGCSCTDLMTKLSLGVALDETERRYMAEHCKK